MKRSAFALFIAIGLFLSVHLTLKAAYEDPAWSHGEAPRQLSANEGYNRYSSMALSDQGTIGVVWARLSPSDMSGTGTRWLTLTQRTADAWGPAITVRQAITNIIAPALVYQGTDWHVAWIEGKPPGASRLLASSAGQTTPQVVHTNLYLYPAPMLAHAANGVHMVYAASSSSSELDRGNIYYTFYPNGGNAWTTPTLLITSSQVITPGVPGSIWRVRMATNPTGTEIHLVWEQHIYAVKTAYEVWYVKGTCNNGNVVLGTPKRLSPSGQFASYPDIALDRQGGVHVVWTEMLEPLTNPVGQYINYRKNLGTGWSIPTRIDSQMAVASNLNPTYIQAALAAGSQRICVAWHGSRDKNNKEELLLTCSPNRGESWQTTVNVSNTPEQLSLFPSIIIDAQEIVTMNWLESRTTNWLYDYEVYVRHEKARLFKLYLPITLRNKSS